MKLKPCPFCGCRRAMLVPWITGQGGFDTVKWSVWCPLCKAYGGSQKSKMEAEIVWNERGRFTGCGGEKAPCREGSSKRGSARSSRAPKGRRR